jgi:hypothetical protein
MNLIKIIENQTIYGAPASSPQLVDLTLKEIIASGKITNPYQLLVLARLSGFFKNGLKSVDLHFENPVNFEDASTSSATKEALKELSDEEHVQLAQYLLDCILAGECLLHHSNSNVIDWIKFVLRRQD